MTREEAIKDLQRQLTEAQADGDRKTELAIRKELHRLLGFYQASEAVEESDVESATLAANKEESKKSLDFFKNAFTRNRLIVADFPEAAYPLKRLNGSAKLAVAQTYLGERTNIEWKSDALKFPTIQESNLSIESFFR